MRILLLFLILFPIEIFCQTSNSIQVLDQSLNEPLIGATVQYQGGNTVTDWNGKFNYSPTSYPDKISITFIGYDDKVIFVNSATDIPNKIYLTDNLVLETMTVTASRYQRRLSESTVSVDVLKPDLIANTNTITIDDALDKVSGVQMVDGQANIRGGSGYSYGAGSRVMLLVDDMPALQTDAGFPNWGDMPVENIDQVEIVKGASSSLYGSAALNGIINIRTGTATNVPKTKIVTAYTQFDNYQDSTKNWSGDTARYTYMLSALHKQKFGRLDAVGSAFYYKEESYLRDTKDNRFRLGLKLKYRISDKAFISINTLVNKGRDSDYFIWENSDDRAVNAFPGSVAQSDIFRYFIDPSFTIEDNYGNNHRLLTRYHRIENNNSSNQSNFSTTKYGEYQFQRNLDSLDVLLTTGLVGSHSSTDAELFGDTTFTTKVFAYYAQLEKKINKLNLSAGLRYEYNEQNTPEEFNGLTVPNGKISAGRWIGRLGASYEYMPYSSLRASWGQGYRFPTITERFITTTFGIFQIAANPDLIPEAGWTAEIGIKQGFKFGEFKGFVDGAIFTSEYEDMMEFTFGFKGFNPTFISKNVGNTKINGLEVSLLGTVDLGPLSISGFGGYTFINPTYRNFENNDSLQYSLSASTNVLKYRSKHNGKIDIQTDYKNFSFGVSYNKSSHVINVDAVFEGRGFEFAQFPDILGVKAYRDQNNNGWDRWDVRISYKYQGLKFSFLVANLANREYTVRPALLEAPRNFTFRLDYEIDWKKTS
ncbi:MAG: outer membrane receptor protein involved in Fe transport [Saprospiraceae bacterium]|jgi:outer membrane receptor protein involved in Fe transport